jgi:hypothetical protein
LATCKSCRAIKNCGTSKVYKCSDPNCTLALHLIKKEPTKEIRKSKIANFPIGHWHVTIFEKHLTSCVSQPKTSVKELATLPAFKGAVLGTQNKVASRKKLNNVVTETYKQSDLSYAKIHRARELVRNSLEIEKVQSYKEIGGLGIELCTNNPSSRICCQLDSKDRFYRFFIILKSSLQSLVPVSLASKSMARR